MQSAFRIQKCDITTMEKLFLDKDGLIRPMPYDAINLFSKNEIYNFMIMHGIYVMPTLELIWWLKSNVIGSAIEIGAGNGAIGRELAIPITDLKAQEDPVVMKAYADMGQPVIKYPDDVEKLEAMDAIEKYKPDTVIGCFITHKHDGSGGSPFGPDLEKLVKSVKRYIHVGNGFTHRESPIMKIPHKEYSADWLITRSYDQSENKIFLYDNL